MAHYDTVFDLGYDYGAQGGRGWNNAVTMFPNGRRRTNQQWADPLGLWAIGNRNVDRVFLDYLYSFHAAMRGSVHSFLFVDWQDHQCNREPLTLTGAATTQLIKTYGAGINPYVRAIAKPKATTVQLYDYDADPGGALLTVDEDYVLDAANGLITWADSPPPGPSADIRWTGDFYVPVHFDRDNVDAQFLAYEERSTGPAAIYALSALFVRETRL